MIFTRSPTVTVSPASYCFCLGNLAVSTGSKQPVKNNIIPPTINYLTKDSECDLDYTPNLSLNKNLDYALSNTFGFGGHNASLIFKRFNE